METTKQQIKEAVSASVYANETLKAINERRAVRKFKDLPLQKELIEQLLDAGRMAPSAINKQPWRFHILTKKEDIRAFSKEISKEVFKGVVKSGIRGIVKTAKEFLHFSHGVDFLKATDPIFHGAPVVIFISSAKSNEWAQLDIGMCSENMMLAAKSLGLDSCPVGMGKFVEKTKIRSKLNIPDTDQVSLALVFGYGDEKPAKKERETNNSFYV